MSLRKAWGHFKTITKHRHKVISHCAKAGILWQGLFHDLSKYTLSEFQAGARHWAEGKRSPNEVEREKYGYSPAWLHHKGRNRHHFEYWWDYSPKAKENLPVKMPVRFLKELICDRVAASKIYRGAEYTQTHPLDYFSKDVASKFIHPATSKEVEKILTILAENGEESMFAYVRELKEY